MIRQAAPCSWPATKCHDSYTLLIEDIHRDGAGRVRYEPERMYAYILLLDAGEKQREQRKYGGLCDDKHTSLCLKAEAFGVPYAEGEPTDTKVRHVTDEWSMLFFCKTEYIRCRHSQLSEPSH